jgi:hypothetical protein
MGRVLRAARYSQVRIETRDGERHVSKRRRAYAPLLVRSGNLLLGLLDTGVRILPQREWEEQERRMHLVLRGADVEVEGRTLLLPHIPGETLATMLEARPLPADGRDRAIGLAVAALAALHRMGFSHGDAMAENVMIDLDADSAHWFDFETAHAPDRPTDWRRADDLRALLATVLLRTAPGDRTATVRLVASAYGDEGVIRLAAASFSRVLRRPLPFHLGQAGLSYGSFREIGRLLG